MNISQHISNSSGPWFVCLTKPRQEAYASLKLREQGYELYVPMLESWARRAGQWCRKQTVMFPRYAFVRPAWPGQSVAPVRSTPGISTLVKFGPVLATLPVDKLAALQALLALLAERASALPGQPLVAGQSVVFAAGPPKGMAGIVSNVAEERVSVLMTLLGQDQNVMVSADDLALA
jgi:transcriptional antiterminator RfaH